MWMAQNFIACDREQALLLPPSLREWLPEDHLAWFVLDAVDAMDLRAFFAGYREDGWGRAAHDPAMIVALLIYAYAIGERSSRRIERRCREDVAVRVVTANQAPQGPAQAATPVFIEGRVWTRTPQASPYLGPAPIGARFVGPTRVRGYGASGVRFSASSRTATSASLQQAATIDLGWSLCWTQARAASGLAVVDVALHEPSDPRFVIELDVPRLVEEGRGPGARGRTAAGDSCPP